MAPVTFKPREITDVLNNPLMGWSPWADGGPYPQPHKMVFGAITWRELEPQKGNYAWNTVETRLKFSYWTGRGVKIVLRIVLDSPGTPSHMDIPDWLYQEIGREGTWYQYGFSPNYKNTKLISNHQRLINALGQRYNNDTRIPFFELGSLGHWGEFHTVYLKATDQGAMPPIAISDQYVRHYLTALPNKILLIRRPFQIAKDYHIGLFNDVFGDPVETARFIRYFNSGYSSDGGYGIAAGTYPAMPDFWKYAPSAGEFADLKYLNDPYIQQTVTFARNSHTSFLGPNCPAKLSPGTALQKNVDLLHNNMGYRFVLQSATVEQTVKRGTSAPVTMAWNNKGPAPFYFKWPFGISLSDSRGNIVARSPTDEDIRTWLPGTKTVIKPLSVPYSLPAGTYTLCVAVIDPVTGAPGMEFAMTGKRSDGRYAVGNITVS